MCVCVYGCFFFLTVRADFVSNKDICIYIDLAHEVIISQWAAADDLCMLSHCCTCTVTNNNQALPILSQIRSCQHMISLIKVCKKKLQCAQVVCRLRIGRDNGATVKYTWICIVRLRANASNSLRYGSYSVTCKQHHICLYSQSPSITALWPVPYSLRLPTEGWPGWVDLGGWLDWDKFPARGAEPRYDHPSQY